MFALTISVVGIAAVRTDFLVVVLAPGRGQGLYFAVPGVISHVICSGR